jgi:hypothetical protein
LIANTPKRFNSVPGHHISKHLSATHEISQPMVSP